MEKVTVYNSFKPLLFLAFKVSFYFLIYVGDSLLF